MVDIPIDSGALYDPDRFFPDDGASCLGCGATV